MPITRFETPEFTYTFPTSPGDQEYSDNFKNIVSHVARLAFVDGGLDENGLGRGASDVGQIQQSLYLVSSTRAGMQTLRDNLNKMQNWGVGRLFFQPVDPNLAERWCICRVLKIDMREERQNHTELFQPVRITYEASLEPFWQTNGNQNLWDGTHTWNGSITWGSNGATTITGSGTINVTPGGNVYTPGRFEASVTGAQAFNQLILRRIVNEGIIDQWVINHQFVQGDLIEVDPRRQWVLINGQDSFSEFEFLHPSWLRLQPGSNSISVVTDQATAQLSCAVRYFERYV